MQQLGLGLLSTVLLMAGACSGANFLFLSPHTSYSHTHFFHFTIKELARRGHTITHWNGLKPREETPNVTHIYSETLHQHNTHHPVGLEDNRRLDMLLDLPRRLAMVCDFCYREPAFKHFLNSSEKFDLIVVESFLNECMLPLVAHFGTPFIYMSALPPNTWMLEATCSPLAAAFCPTLGTTFTEDMNIFVRTFNTVIQVAGIYFKYWYVMPMVDSIVVKASNGRVFPPIREVDSNVSMFITNTHFSLYHHYPKMSNIVEVAGLQLVPPQPLPLDVIEFVEGSGDAGFIVLSFGSVVRGSSMPEKTRKIFISAFSRLPQRVLWKWENASGMPDLPDNVRLSTWLPPLLDLMAHPKMRLVMTHGGLFSNQEAVWSGVPLIAFPVFGDQDQYAARAQKEGYGFHLDWRTITEESLYEKIHEIINNPKYKERALQMSEFMRDQVDHPLDRAVNAIEYVARHRGAPHLRPASCNLSILQRESMDVNFIVSCFLLLLTYSVIRLAISSVRRIFNRFKLSKLKTD